MPVTKQAIKKLRQDKRKTTINSKIKAAFLSAVKGIRKSNGTTLTDAYSKIDTAAKNGIIHKNKASRLKSQLAKIAPAPAKSTKKPVARKASPKKARPSK